MKSFAIPVYDRKESRRRKKSDLVPVIRARSWYLIISHISGHPGNYQSQPLPLSIMAS